MWRDDDDIFHARAVTDLSVLDSKLLQNARIDQARFAALHRHRQRRQNLSKDIHHPFASKTTLVPDCIANRPFD